MKCLTDEEQQAMRDEERTQFILYLARQLVQAADNFGLVVTIDQRSVPPLAMGNYATAIDVRPERKKA